MNKSVDETIEEWRIMLRETPLDKAFLVTRSELQRLVDYFDDLKTFENSL